MALSRLWKLMFPTVFLVIPFVSFAAEPFITGFTGVNENTIYAPIIYDETFSAMFELVGENLEYLYAHRDQKDPPVVRLGASNPIEIGAPATDGSVGVEFRIRASDYLKNQYAYLRTFDTNGELIQQFDTPILIYDDAFILPTIDSVTPSLLSITSEVPYDRTIVITGNGLKYLKDKSIEKNVVRFGKARHTSIDGNMTAMNITFRFRPKQFTAGKYRRIRMYRDGKVIARSKKIPLFNPFALDYNDRHLNDYFNATQETRVSKRTIGLNVHYGLGADSEAKEVLYKNALRDSSTQWVREHISYAEVMGEDRRDWLEKYDRIFRYYKKKNMRVVVMLAYGAGGGYTPPSQEDWADFVQIVSQRYRNYVDAWEVWNEPDLAQYLNPNTVDALLPLLRTAYPIIKEQAPGSVVLNGAIGNIRTTSFMKELYSKAGDYFDELSVHAYYCDEYQRDGDVDALVEDFNVIATARPSDRQDEGIWVTELGCSMGTSGVSESVQRNYMRDATQALLSTGKVRNVLLYTIMDRPEQDEYEANFGLLYGDGAPKDSWEWYDALPNE